jgi:hypothetical protein
MTKKEEQYPGMSIDKGLKFDGGKPPLDLLPY